jgi:hypothetical protein
LKLTGDELAKIMQHRKTRDINAYMAGVATMEWRKHLAALEAGTTFSEAQEMHDGTQILREHGLDPSKGEYRILGDGRVVELVNGQYVNPETKEPEPPEGFPSLATLMR